MIPLPENFPAPPPGKTGWPWTVDAAADDALRDASGGETDWPRISLVTPSYNQGQYIEETIRSILLQGYPNLEYFIMDGGSTDNAVAIIKKYEPWLAGWVSEKDKGMAHAINKGWARATGEVCGYLNSDDWYFPGALHVMGRTFGSQPSVSWVAGEVHNGWSPKEIVTRHVPHPTSLVECLGRKNYGFHQPGMFWRRSLVEKIGPLNETRHYSFCHDFWVRSLLAAYEMHCLPTPITFFRLHRQSQSVTQQHIFLSGDWAVFAKYQPQLTPAQASQAREWLQEYEAENLPGIVYAFLARGCRGEAMRFLLDRLTLLPKSPHKRTLPGLFFRTLISGRPPAWFRN